MKTVISHAAAALVLATLLSTATARAAEEPASSLGENAGTTTAEGFWANSAPVSYSIGAGAAYHDGNTGWAITTGLARQVSEASPLFLSLDLGLNFWSFNSPLGGPSMGATGIALLPSVVYGFQFAGIKTARPFIGLAVGPQLYLERGQTARVFLQLMVRPGVNFAVSDVLSLNVEPKFGILGGSFAFLPTASAVMAL